ncbi:hypothetical protein AYI70_g9925 [Smittium culicis]|uniref:Uncharacterized protein n=1 Tax=Smittium culicis TaxID=133412 RepID=A0A1R1X8Z6_9FUNG|nr:hypothetical protein AYI70_g9925 [Smittium culicis]
MPLSRSSSSISTESWIKSSEESIIQRAGRSGICPYAFSQCPEGLASGTDTLLEVDDRPVISSFSDDYRNFSLAVLILRAKFFYPPGAPGHPGDHN